MRRGLRFRAGAPPAAGIPLHRPGSLLDWRETGTRTYVGGDYQIALAEPHRWEIRHRGDLVDFDGSRESSFRIAEDHHRERLRTRDLITFGSVATASAIALLGMITIPPSTVWLFAMGGLYIALVSATMEFLYTLARIGRLRGGARYAMPHQVRASGITRTSHS